MGNFFKLNSKVLGSKFWIRENLKMGFSKNIDRKISRSYFKLTSFICRIINGLMLVSALGLFACSSMQERSWRLARGMSPLEVEDILGSPAQRLPARLMYQVPYICKKVPFYVTFRDGHAVSWGVSPSIADAASSDCARDEAHRIQRQSEIGKASSLLMQTQFGSQPTQMGQKLEPLMQNCWMDASGWHCL
jgi:hypothetical protein